MRSYGRDRLIDAAVRRDNALVIATERLLSGLKDVETGQRGFILTGQELMRDGKRPKGWTLDRDPGLLETSVPGVFAVGDVRRNSVKRVASSVGEGSVAISFVHQYLSKV